MARGTGSCRYAPASAPVATVTALVAVLILLAGCTATITGQAIRRPTAGATSAPPTSPAPPTSLVPTSSLTPTSSLVPLSTSAGVASTTPTPSSDVSTPTDSPTSPATTSPVFPTMISTSGVPDSEVGLKPNAPAATLTVRGATDSEADIIAIDALADLYDYYDSIFGKDFGQHFVPPAHLVSFDSRDRSGRVCGDSTYQFVNAAFSSSCDTVAWDRGVLLPELISEIGPLAPAVVLSHEIGHSVQHQLGVPADTSTLTLEQQADCYAGAFWRWVGDGHSTYFNFNQTEGMRQLLLTLFQGHDPVGSSGSGDLDHGNGFDRTYSVTLGYTSGAVRCSQINNAEIAQRGQEFPFTGIPQDYGNLKITEDSVSGIISTVDDYFGQTAPGYVPPTLSTFTGTTPPPCDGYTSSYPVTYCPTTNTVSYNLAELRRIGTPTAGWESANGDFSAFVLLVSRYALAAQAAGHSSITGNDAGMRALCYTGTWATWLRNPQDGYQLSPNDLDKAIYQIVSSPLPGADANGQSTATLIERVQAFDIGVTHPITECFDFYSG